MIQPDLCSLCKFSALRFQHGESKYIAPLTHAFYTCGLIQLGCWTHVWSVSGVIWMQPNVSPSFVQEVFSGPGRGNLAFLYLRKPMEGTSRFCWKTEVPWGGYQVSGEAYSVACLHLRTCWEDTSFGVWEVFEALNSIIHGIKYLWGLRKGHENFVSLWGLEVVLSVYT